jgi:hypothetical protein
LRYWLALEVLLPLRACDSPLCIDPLVLGIVIGGLVMRFGLANRGGELSCSSRSGGSGVRVSARPDIFASEPPRRLASDHRVFLAKVQLDKWSLNILKVLPVILCYIQTNKQTIY